MPITSSNISIAILAGGRSSRMGTDKSRLLLQGRPIFEHVLERLTPLNLPVIIIANDLEKYRCYELPIFPDVIPNGGSLGGLYSAIYCSKSDYTLCVGCDMPFLNTNLLAYLVAQCGDYDLVVPRVDGLAQPFHAVYNKNCLSTIHTHIGQGRLRASGFYASLKVRWVEAEELSAFDPAYNSFVNINTPEEYQAAQLSI
jgi:molybdopterin-guanine dinucleotide biosynthesis protein A